MESIGFICLLIGGLIGLIYGVFLLIKAFQESMLWGLGSIFIPFVSLVFVVIHWQDAKGPFLKGLIAVPFYLVGAALTVKGTI